MVSNFFSTQSTDTPKNVPISIIAVFVDSAASGIYCTNFIFHMRLQEVVAETTTGPGLFYIAKNIYIYIYSYIYILHHITHNTHIYIYTDYVEKRERERESESQSDNIDNTRDRT